MTETYKILRYYFITEFLIIMLTVGMCGFFIARSNSEFALFGNSYDNVAKPLYLMYNKF